MALESGIYRRHRTSFVLDADTLRRIEGILRKGTQDYGELLEVVYHVEREDHRFYETHSIDDVISDPNALTKRINLLSIDLRSTGSNGLIRSGTHATLSALLLTINQTPHHTAVEMSFLKSAARIALGRSLWPTN